MIPSIPACRPHVDDDGLFHAFSRGKNLRSFTRDGTPNRTWNQKDIRNATDMAIGPGGILYVVDERANLVVGFDLRTQRKAGQLRYDKRRRVIVDPADIAVDGYGFLYVVDKGKKAILKFAPRVQ